MRDYILIQKAASEKRRLLLLLQALKLSNFNFSTSFSQLGFQVFSFSFAYALFNSLGSAVNQFFGFFQAQTGQVFYDFNDVQLVGAGSFQYYVKRSFFFSSRGSTTGSRAGNGNGSSSRLNAIFVFQDGSQFVYLFYSQVYELFGKLFQIGHDNGI